MLAPLVYLDALPLKTVSVSVSRVMTSTVDHEDQCGCSPVVVTAHLEYITGQECEVVGAMPMMAKLAASIVKAVTEVDPKMMMDVLDEVAQAEVVLPGDDGPFDTPDGPL